MDWFSFLVLGSKLRDTRVLPLERAPKGCSGGSVYEPFVADVVCCRITVVPPDLFQHDRKFHCFFLKHPTMGTQDRGQTNELGEVAYWFVYAGFAPACAAVQTARIPALSADPGRGRHRRAIPRSDKHSLTASNAPISVALTG